MQTPDHAAEDARNAAEDPFEWEGASQVDSEVLYEIPEEAIPELLRELVGQALANTPAGMEPGRRATVNYRAWGTTKLLTGEIIDWLGNGILLRDEVPDPDGGDPRTAPKVGFRIFIPFTSVERVIVHEDRAEEGEASPDE